MTPREYLSAYVKQHDGIGPTAARLGMPYPTFAAICNGTRGISPKTAKRMVEADPLLDANRLVWVRPTKTEARAA